MRTFTRFVLDHMQDAMGLLEQSQQAAQVRATTGREVTARRRRVYTVIGWSVLPVPALLLIGAVCVSAVSAAFVYSAARATYAIQRGLLWLVLLGVRRD